MKLADPMIKSSPAAASSQRCSRVLRSLFATLSLALLSPAMAMAQTAPSAGAPATTVPAAAAAAASTISAGDTAWMMVSTALVLMMTVPGLAMFYGGMVRKMNVLATMMQCFAICCLVTILWMVIGYSLAFTEGNQWLGGTSQFMLKNLKLGSISDLAKTIPETVYMTYQMTFAIITPALICGAFADRMKFSAMLVFMALWSLVVYAPIAHWVWGPGGFLGNAGVLDFAGGTVVHINAGVAGLVCALVLGKRRGYGREPFVPHNLTTSLIGASLLWVGWFGFNAGSALAANDRAGMAMVATQIATAAAALSWMAAEWALKGKPSVLGIISGAVAGLVAITPASGYVLPGGALVIGIVAGVVCYWGATGLKHMLGYDDSLDAFGVHGVGGIVGALLTGIFATTQVAGMTTDTPPAPIGGWIDGNLGQLWTQCYGVAISFVYCAVASFILLKIIDLVMGLRVDEEVERDGLDLALHGETVP